MVQVCCNILLYPTTIRMHIKLPSFLDLWFHLHLSGIPLSLFSSSRFPPQLCPPYRLPPNFLTVTCLHLSSGMGYDVGGLPYSSVPPCYSYCFCPSCSLVFFVLRMEMKLEVPPSDVLGNSLTLCETIISILNCYPGSPLTKTLLLEMIEALIVCRNGHENMVLHDTPSPKARETVTGFPLTTKGFLEVITAVTSTPPFPCSPYFPPSTIDGNYPFYITMQ